MDISTRTRSGAEAGVDCGARSAVRPLREHAWFALWLVLLVVPLVVRGPLPPDELRYLSVAWEMWNSGDFLVPYLNGTPYADKPPLLFWLMHAGWVLFGVGDGWPRLLPGLCALGVVVSTRALAGELDPGDAALRRSVPWLLLGSLGFSLSTQVLLFDLLLANWVLLAWIGLVRAERGAAHGWLMFGGALALGVLTKGPVMLLHLAGPALLAPWWASRARFVARRWFTRLGVAVVAGGAVALLWALGAAQRGGADYARSLLFDQTAGRIVESFAHARPVWFYLWVLPVLLLPWSAWPAVWRGLARCAMRRACDRRAVRLLSAMTVPALVALCAASGKQPHYLIPLIPPLAIAIGRGLRLVTPRRGAAALALGVPLGVIALETAFFAVNVTAYDTHAAAVTIHRLQDAGRPIVYAGKYHGEFHFSGRLVGSLDMIDPPDAAAIARWADAHPDGYVVRTGAAVIDNAVYYRQRFRGSWLTITPAARSSSRVRQRRCRRLE